MKPTYTVRLTGDLDADERQRIAARVAGVTEIEADKIERLLERGLGRDLIKPSSANVANRLASVLAEAGAPVQLVPVTEPDPTQPEAAEPGRSVPTAADEDVLRPRQSGAAREVPDETAAGPSTEPPEELREEPSPEPVAPVVPPVEPSEVAPVEAADESSDADVEPAEEDRRAATDRRVTAGAGAAPPPPATGAEAALPEPEADAAPETEPAAVPEPEVTVTPPADPGVRAHPADEEREPPPPPRTVEPPRTARTNGNSALLGAAGAAVLGIGAVFAMDLLVNPIAIGVLVLAVLALALSLLGQRRATWLPGLGALALVVWALANAADGPMASLAANWQWYAMFAGSLLVIVAGFQEAQRGRGR